MGLHRTLSGLGLSGSGRCFWSHSPPHSYFLSLFTLQGGLEEWNLIISGRHQEHHQQVSLSPLLSPAESLRRAVPRAGLPSPAETGTLEQILPRLRTLTTWGEARVFCLDKRKLREITPMHINTQCDGLENMEPTVFQWKDEEQWNTKKNPFNHKKELYCC